MEPNDYLREAGLKFFYKISVGLFPKVRTILTKNNPTVKR
jgi:hypothetical protein